MYAILIAILEFVLEFSSFVVCHAVSIEILVTNDIIKLKSACVAISDQNGYILSSVFDCHAVSIEILVKNDILKFESAFVAKNYIFC